MDASCQCGAVAFKTPLPEPLALYICHCTSCQRQTSSAYSTSAIFPRFPFPAAELLSCYVRPTGTGDSLYCYFCKICGTRMIHTTPTKNVVSIKGGCISGLDWKKAVHIWTRSAMVPIPEGSESHSEWSSSETQESLSQPDTPSRSLQGNGWELDEEAEQAERARQLRDASSADATPDSALHEMVHV
ncbi:hypothetical protein RB597_002021 [Gaeumannomyces tritici]